jgi:hypothetical protein
MKRQLLFVLAAFLALPAAALGDCQPCHLQLVCEPNCTLTEMCKQAGDGEVGGFCNDDPVFGCQVSNPCMLVERTPAELFSPMQHFHLKPAVVANARALRCS